MLPRSRALVPLVLVAACTGSAQREAASLTYAVDQYRRADTATRAAREDEVQMVACTVQRVCDAKVACLAAIRPTTHALALKDEVAARVLDLEQGKITKDSPEATALPAKLKEAQELLEEGREKMGGCDAALLALKADVGG